MVTPLSGRRKKGLDRRFVLDRLMPVLLAFSSAFRAQPGRWLVAGFYRGFGHCAAVGHTHGQPLPASVEFGRALICQWPSVRLKLVSPTGVRSLNEIR